MSIIDKTDTFELEALFGYRNVRNKFNGNAHDQ